eukprot:scaffold12171_cov14-Tisochrysis_lutea.AAC.1
MQRFQNPEGNCNVRYVVGKCIANDTSKECSKPPYVDLGGGAHALALGLAPWASSGLGAGEE